MNVFAIIIAGWVANFIYTLYSRVMFRLYRINRSIPEILGYAFIQKFMYNQHISRKAERVPIGNTIHYLVGIAFSFAFAMLSGKIVAGLFTFTIIFGLVHGIIAVIAWFFLLRSLDVFPDFRIRNYLWVVFTGHFIYAFGLMLVFNYGFTRMG